MALSQVLLECYGTANYFALESAFAPISMHIDSWASTSFSKQQFVQHGVTMFYLLDALCNTLEFQAVEIVFRRLEMQHVIQPFGVFETILLLVTLRRFFDSHHDNFEVLKSCQRAKKEEDIFVGRTTYTEFLLPRLEFARTLVVYDFAYDVLALLFAKVPVKQTRASKMRKHVIKRMDEPKFLTTLFVVLFCAKLKRTIRPRVQSVVWGVLFLLKLQERVAKLRLRNERKLRKRLLRQERANMLFIRKKMTSCVLPQLVRVVSQRQRVKFQHLARQKWSIMILCARALVRWKHFLEPNKVHLHRSSHSMEGIVYYWRKLARRQSIRRTILADVALVQKIPLTCARIRDKIMDRKVNNFLFLNPKSRGHNLYWDFRFACHLLRLVHEGSLQILSFLQMQTKQESPRFVREYMALVKVLINPFEKRTDVTISVIDDNTIQPMIVLLDYLLKNKFIKRLQEWLHSKPNLQMYDTCLSFFVLILDVFTNMKHCFQRITFACAKVLYALYYSRPDNIDVSSHAIFHNCTKHYPRFDGLFVMCKQGSLAAVIDNWLQDCPEVDLVAFLHAVEDAKEFVAGIEQDKSTRKTKNTFELRAKLHQRKELLRHK